MHTLQTTVDSKFIKDLLTKLQYATPHYWNECIDARHKLDEIIKRESTHPTPED